MDSLLYVIGAYVVALVGNKGLLSPLKNSIRTLSNVCNCQKSKKNQKYVHMIEKSHSTKALMENLEVESDNEELPSEEFLQIHQFIVQDGNKQIEPQNQKHEEKSQLEIENQNQEIEIFDQEMRSHDENQNEYLWSEQENQSHLKKTEEIENHEHQDISILNLSNDLIPLESDQLIEKDGNEENEDSSPTNEFPISTSEKIDNEEIEQIQIEDEESNELQDKKTSLVCSSLLRAYKNGFSYLSRHPYLFSICFIKFSLWIVLFFQFLFLVLTFHNFFFFF